MTIWERRAKQALRVATDFACHRYLISNSHGRWDGFEKAQSHRELCETFVATFRNVKPDQVSRLWQDDYDAVHEATQKLTGYLDREIGFPLEEAPDFDDMIPKFFNRFYEIAVKTLTKKGRPK